RGSNSPRMERARAPAEPYSSARSKSVAGIVAVSSTARAYIASPPLGMRRPRRALHLPRGTPPCIARSSRPETARPQEGLANPAGLYRRLKSADRVPAYLRCLSQMPISDGARDAGAVEDGLVDSPRRHAVAGCVQRRHLAL